MNDTPRVLIVNGQNWLGLSRLPAVLRGAGCRVTVFGPAGGGIERSRFVDEVVRAPRDTAGQVAALRDHLAVRRGRYAWVVIGDDPTLVELARYWDEAWVRAIYPVDMLSPALAYAHSKAAFAEAAPEFDVPIPASEVCSSLEECLAAADEMGYPVMLKADVGMAGDGVRRADSSGELAGAFALFRERVPLVVQKFVPGRVGLTEALFDRGRPACFFSSYKRECHPVNGPACVREICDFSDCERVLANLGRMTGFHGLCGVDWIRDGSGRFHVLELNARPTPAYHLGRHAGVDFALALHHFVRRRPHTQRPRPGAAGTVYQFPQHVLKCVGQHTRRGLLKWVPLVARHDVPWTDPALVWWHVHRLAPVVMESLLGSLRRKAGRVTRLVWWNRRAYLTPT